MIPCVTSIKMIRDSFFIIGDEYDNPEVPARVIMASEDQVLNVGADLEAGEVPAWQAAQWLNGSEAAPHTVNGNPFDPGS